MTADDDERDEFDVDVLHDLPGVGQGLQDHPLVPVVWPVRSGRSLIRGGPIAGVLADELSVADASVVPTMTTAERAADVDAA